MFVSYISLARRRRRFCGVFYAPLFLKKKPCRKPRSLKITLFQHVLFLRYTLEKRVEKGGHSNWDQRGFPLNPDFLASTFCQSISRKRSKTRFQKKEALKSAVMQWSSCPRMSKKKKLKKRSIFQIFCQKIFNFQKFQLFHGFLT